MGGFIVWYREEREEERGVSMFERNRDEAKVMGEG